MSVQFVLGTSGSGKSTYIYNKIIEESMATPNVNYILLVPEQYSMILQRKMVELHPAGGTMNIDVIGFNRLAYRVFDELGTKNSKVLEDFGKSMLIRQVAGSIKDDLQIYGISLDKPGFIDEVKSLMSELYQYDMAGNKINEIIAKLGDEDNGTSLLKKKLMDMSLIYDAFAKRIGDEYIVAEEITELLVSCIPSSELIKKSVIVMDGFTGFTPIQLSVIEQLMIHSMKIYSVLTIDRENYEKETIGEHELFYLTSKTIKSVCDRAKANNIPVMDHIFVEENTRKESSELAWLEANLFRYPYKKYECNVENISITHYENMREEIAATASIIRSLVRSEGYRYKDFAIVTGALTQAEGLVNQLMPKYDIPYFLDYSMPVKNNPFIDGLCHAIRCISESFSYDSIFAFLKSGAVNELDDMDIELMENYVLAKGIKGLWMWQKKWIEELDNAREYVLELFQPFMENGKLVKTAKISDFVKAVLQFMTNLDYEKRIGDAADRYDEAGSHELAKLYEQLYGKITEILDKMLQIMPDETAPIDEFYELFELGLKDVKMGIIPSTLDMVIVGDITRTRLDSIKVLFMLDVNDGIIPSKGNPAQIISDRDKEKLSLLGYELAPTDKINAYIEQFYLYTGMTKPRDRLYISYVRTNSDNEAMRPSYMIERICNIFPKLTVNDGKSIASVVTTKEASVEILITFLKRLMDGHKESLNELNSLYRLYRDMGETELLDTVKKGIEYSNVPYNLKKDVYGLIKLKLATQSVSRLEQYAGCAYSYFLKYIAGLKERQIKELDNISIGNVLHSAMERLYRHVHDNMGNDWEGLAKDKRDKLVESFVGNAFDTEFEDSDGRVKYLRNVLVRIGQRTAEMLKNITCRDMLKPEYFEYKFERRLEHENNAPVTLKGVVDRGDIYYDREQNLVKLRIIDYKSGNYDFKINELYEGLQLQLAVYMNVMVELVKEQYGRGASDGLRIIPEGMYYYQFKDPYVDADDENKALAEREKKLVLKGLNNEGGTVNNIAHFAMKKAGELADKILEGDISKNPVINKGKAACEYCPYKSVCRFDDRYGGNEYRHLRYGSSDRELVYNKIVEELGGKTDGLDG
ncbi:MAG: PD-(D/E)XK nuclease family protein [Lachnospiraceae bacterium]|nr:PD-(D/E)XK nuclease family protein [Lachnospiraceae bacterium]